MGDVSVATTPPQTDDPTTTAAETTTVTVRYFAAARAAAGSDEETITVADPATIGSVIAAASRRHGDEFVTVLERCSYLHNATAVHDLAAPIASGDQLDVLPPFAGG